MLMFCMTCVFILLASKGFLFFHGLEFPPLDLACIAYGVGILLYSLIAFLRFPKRIFNAEAMVVFYPSLVVLGIIVACASMISYGNSEEPFLLLTNNKFVSKKLLVRLPGSNVMHFDHHPLNGIIHRETRVQRGFETSYGTNNAVMIKVKAMITYDIGTHEPRNHFPELYKFDNKVRDSLLTALYEIPPEAEPQEYESENFKRILSQKFSESFKDYGFESFHLGYNCKLHIKSIEAQSLKNLPDTERWSHAIVGSNVTKRSYSCTAHLLRCLWSFLFSF